MSEVNYPASLDTSVGIGTAGAFLSTGGSSSGGAAESHVVAHADISQAIVSLETIAGITSSNVTTTYEYRIRKLYWGQWPGGLLFCPAASAFPTFTTVNSIPLLSYPQTTNNTATFIGRVPLGAVVSGGATIRINWASTATSGNVIWITAFEVLGAAAITADHFGSTNTVTTTVSASASFGNESVVSQSSVNLNSVVAGSVFRLQLVRSGTTDTMAAAATVYYISIESTT